mmetsp:Transcript_17977/g.32590  ORF Transcript_17977/g.32590 Transcript_17977/m.32590 type:complete len:210 (+) Transcript_17977:662-1291(+)
MLEVIIFSAKTSFLLRNSIMLVLANARLLQTELKSSIASTMRLVRFASARVWSYSLSAATKMTASTPSKQSIHLRRSARCPPTSYISNSMPSMMYFSMTTCVVLTRAKRTSCVVGRYDGAAILETSRRYSLCASITLTAARFAQTSFMVWEFQRTLMASACWRNCLASLLGALPARGLWPTQSLTASLEGAWGMGSVAVLSTRCAMIWS